MTLKTWPLTTILMLLLTASLSGADQRAGSKGAIMFGFKDYYRLNSFDGTSLSYKKMIDEHNEYRFSISLTGEYISPETENSSVYNVISQDTVLLSSGGYSRKDNALYMNLGAYRIWHQKNDHRVNFYCGAGPYLWYSYSYHQTQEKDYNKNEIDETTRTSIAAGLRGLLGAEVKVMDRVSVHGEYRSSMSYGKSSTEYKESWEYTDKSDNGFDKRETETLSFYFGGTTLFGVSLYF